MASQKKRSKPSSTRLDKRLSLLWRRAFRVVNGLLLVPVLLSLLAPWISPTDAPWLGYLGLTVPLLLLVPLLWLVFWLIYDIRTAIPNLVVLLFHLPNLTSQLQLSGHNQADHTIRVVSYNVNAFYNRTDRFLETLQTLRALKPDILLLQEYYKNDNQRLGPITDTLRRALGLKHVAFMPLAPPNFGLAVFSRYPIERQRRIWPAATDTLVTNGVQAVDLRLFGRTLRVYNLHLQSYFVLRQVSGDSVQPFSKPEQARQFRALAATLPLAWGLQQAQLMALDADRSTCPHPVLLGGDLNNPPFGYAYFQATRGLQDAFRARGNGLGFTYRHPYIKYRIDYLAVDPLLEVLSYRSPAVGPSDHRPVVVELVWKDQTSENKVY